MGKEEGRIYRIKALNEALSAQKEARREAESNGLDIKVHNAAIDKLEEMLDDIQREV